MEASVPQSYLPSYLQAGGFKLPFLVVGGCIIILLLFLLVLVRPTGMYIHYTKGLNIMLFLIPILCSACCYVFNWTSIVKLLAVLSLIPSQIW